MTSSRRRGLLVALLAAIAALAAIPQGASAGHWWIPPYWNFPIHIHGPQNPAYAFRNDVNENGTLQTQAEYSRGEWSASPYVDLYNVPSWGGQGLHVMDAHYGRTGWYGWAEGICPCDTVYGHASYFNNLLNLTYLTDPNEGVHYWQWKKAIACQEIGHMLSMGHMTPSCMGAAYGSDPFTTAGRTPSAHDFDHVGYMFSTSHPNHGYW